MSQSRALGQLLVLVAVAGALTGISRGVDDNKAQDQWLIVHCGTLLAVPGKAPQENASVIVKNGRIVEVRTGLIGADALTEAQGSKVETIDLSGSFVLPGLIDCHTHITGEMTANSLLRRVQESDADAAINSVVYAKRTLEAGFTTIRNVGSRGDAVFALRDAINSGLVPGPRILAAGAGISPTGGHGDPTHGFRDDLFDTPGAAEGIADGPAACRQAVRTQVKRGADVIKFVATGGVLSVTAAGTEQQFFDDELRAIVDTGHLLGRKVAAHAHGTKGLNAALRAGVDSIEHGSFLDDESISLFNETGAFLVPTLLAGKTVTERAQEPGYFPPAVAEKVKAVGPVIQGAFAKAVRGGVKIAFGTDSGVSEHGRNAEEFALMVEAGMSQMRAIVCATINAAELCGLSDEIGTIEPGKAADIIAVDANPLTDIKALQNVSFVMRNGVVYKRP